MHNSKSVSTPISTLAKLTAVEGSSFEDPQLYRSIVGSLQYLAFTHPDFSFSFNKVGCPDDRKSTGGFCMYFGSHLESWGSKKQPTVARSSTEAEYKAVANTSCELL
ncbi:hypothetical protein F2P56_002574 [Juglans regia]|uniref:Mitochondrial protein n=1 Tax=Juglans regia TaxID=51240 RepID=A0A833YCU1_JUGRE|nr:hypothetical protein F2P56_002574 [Juglans regia]